jgi:nitric oxide reductase NorQ protein
LIKNGISVRDACRVAICLPLSDDERLQETLSELVEDIFDAS